MPSRIVEKQNLTGVIWIQREFFWNVGFEVLRAVAMNSSVFWNITPCSPMRDRRH
jgi:hypothetical protein